jgi:hypothetical protein
VLTFPRIPSYVFIGLPFGMASLARSLQGDSYREHVAAGGAEISNWKALGMGVVCLIPTMLLLGLTAFGMRVIGRTFGF